MKSGKRKAKDKNFIGIEPKEKKDRKLQSKGN
jgi:hypothetical protein